MKEWMTSTVAVIAIAAFVAALAAYLLRQFGVTDTLIPVLAAVLAAVVATGAGERLKKK